MRRLEVERAAARIRPVRELVLDGLDRARHREAVREAVATAEVSAVLLVGLVECTHEKHGDHHC